MKNSAKLKARVEKYKREDKPSKPKTLEKRKWRLKPRELDELAKLKPRVAQKLLAKGTMLTVESVPSISVEVAEGFKKLLQADAAILRDFERVYQKRMQFPGVPESRQDATGLGSLLVHLLSSNYAVPATIPKSSGKRSSSLENQLSEAIQLASHDEPTAFLIFKANMLKKGCNPEQALAGILRDYVDREDVVPY